MRRALPASLLALGMLALSGCSPDSGTSASAVQTAASICPKTTLPPAPILMLMRMIGPRFVLATTIEPADTSTSHVLTPDPNRQIECGKTPIAAVEDVVYSRPRLPDGAVKALAMDLLIPEGSRTDKPLVVYVPGGGFLISPKEGALDLRTYVAEAGFVVASIQYRTSRDGATYRDGLIDLKAAIRFLRAHAKEYGIDARNVAVWGESAGGYLVAMAGVTNGRKEFEEGENLESSSSVQAVVDKFGPTDTSQIAADFDVEAQRAAAAADTGTAKYIDSSIAKTTANPLTYIDASSAPFLILHGSRDTMISPSQTLMIHNALLAAQRPSTRYVLDGADHGDLAFMGDEESGRVWSTQEVMDTIVAFLKDPLHGRVSP